MVKKPPIRLSELVDDVEEESRGQPGGLSYVQSGDRNGASDGNSGSGGGRDWKGIFGSVIVSVFLAGLLILFLTPSKASIKVLDKNLLEVAGRLDAVKSKVDGVVSDLGAKVDAAIVEARSAKEALGGYAKITDIPAAPDLSTYAKDSDVTSLQTELAALKVKLAALEVAKEEEEAVTDEAILAELSQSYLYLSNGETISGTIFLEVSNDSAKDVTLDGIDLVLFPAQPSGATYLSTCTVSSNLIMTWTAVSLGNNMFLIQGRPMAYVGGPVIDADDSDDYLLTFTFGLKTDTLLPETGLTLGVKVNDYSYKEVT